MVFPAHAWPQSVAARTTGMSSWTVIWAEDAAPLHCSWNHLESQKAPHPHPPEVLEVTVWSGMSFLTGASMEVH